MKNSIFSSSNYHLEYTPDEAELNDLDLCLEKVTEKFSEEGIIKIMPPAKWVKGRRKELKKFNVDVEIPYPLRQSFARVKGHCYQQTTSGYICRDRNKLTIRKFFDSTKTPE